MILPALASALPRRRRSAWSPLLQTSDFGEWEASASPRLADCAHLRSFRAEYGNKARAGLLLHTGSSVEWLSPDVLAAPWWRVI